jgi:threonine dehydratase
MDLDIRDEVLTAYDLIKSYVRKTPLDYSPQLSELCGCKVYIKLENWQVTGSFKVRGALNKILPLRGSAKKPHVVTASTGNHAAAVGHSLEKIGLTGTIFLPENVPSAKVKKLDYYKGVKLETYGNDSVITEKKAHEYADQNGYIYVSPYNDMEVINGQGTIALEISEQLEDIDSVFVPVGGGGLISGISGYLKSISGEIEIIGCQAKNSAVMAESVKCGRILDLPSLPTFSDGTAGGVEEDSITFEFCRNLVDSWTLVEENEIISALRLLMTHHNMVVEGSAGLALASLIKEKERYANKSVVLILCGSKFSDELLKELICE